MVLLAFLQDIFAQSSITFTNISQRSAYNIGTRALKTKMTLHAKILIQCIHSIIDMGSKMW